MLKVRLLPFGKRQLPLQNEDASLLDKWNIFWLGGDIIEGNRQDVIDFVVDFYDIEPEDFEKVIAIV
jgi:hypothetical protein